MLDLFPHLRDPRRSGRLALRFPDRELTYGELAALVDGLAGPLAGRDRVAVWAEPRIETAVAVAASLVAGVAVVPLNPSAGERELTHLIADSRCEALMIAADAELPIAAAGLKPIRLDLDALPAGADQAPGEVPDAALGPEAPALIVYTSGTTGPPKGAVLPRRALVSNLDALAAAWDWGAPDTVVQGLPLFHVHGLGVGVLGPLRLGGAVHHVGRFDAAAISAALAGGGTMLFAVPTMYRRLAALAEEDPDAAAALRGARLLVSGSAALSVAEHRRIEALTGQRVVERYGMTETLMNTAVRADGDRAAGYVGPPVEGVELRLVDDDGAAIEGSDDETFGEVQVRGPNLLLGYLEDGEPVPGTIEGGWFRTGDLATRRADGYFRIVGRRATDLIMTGGFKVGAGEIESVLREHPAVADAAVVGAPDPELGEIVVAWIVTEPGAEVAEAELTDLVASTLVPYKRPRRVRFIDELPRNALGKVQKKRL